MLELSQQEVLDLKQKVMKQMEVEMLQKLRADFEEVRLSIFHMIRETAVSRCSTEVFKRLSMESHLDDLTRDVTRSVEAELTKVVKSRLGKGIKIKLVD